MGIAKKEGGHRRSNGNRKEDERTGNPPNDPKIANHPSDTAKLICPSTLKLREETNPNKHTKHAIII
jgi:hypothetical protein